MTIELAEDQRQLTLLALATLCLERPGFDYALGEVAKQLHGLDMYNEFKKLNADKAQFLQALFRRFPGINYSEIANKLFDVQPLPASPLQVFD